MRVALSEVLVGICSQQLLRRADRAGRVAAQEILVANTAVRNLIREGKTHQVNNVITTGRKEGMRLLDHHLRELVEQGIVAAAEAARYTSDPNSLAGAEPRARP